VSSERGDLLAALAPIAKALRRIEDAAAARVGLTMWQYAILSAATETPRLNQAQVATRLGYSRNSIVGDLDLLEEKRLIRRVPGPDRRANQLTATPAGTRLVRRIRAEIHHQEDDVLSVLPVDQRRTFLEAASVLAQALRGPQS
jgi:DNA-binding MarR family transcriptional regulator